LRWIFLSKNEPLRFRALNPNYEVYWQRDSDAAVSVDSFETSCGSAAAEMIV